MMNNKVNELPCEIVEDLLPIYVDGLASQISNEAIKNHLDSCRKCAAVYDAMSDTELLQPNIEGENKRDVNYLKKIKSKHKKAIVGIVSAILVVVIAFVYFFNFKIYSIPVDGFHIEEKYITDKNELYVVVAVDKGFSELGVYSYRGEYSEDLSVYSVELGYRMVNYIQLDHEVTGYYYFLIPLDNAEEQIYLNRSLLLWDSSEVVERAPDDVLETLPEYHSGFWRTASE